MLYVICFYVISVAMIHTLLFTKAKYMSRVLLINSAISCMAVAMLLLAYYFKDTNFIDVIFFYIIMSPIGFYGIFIYYKNMAKNNKDAINEPNKNVILPPKIDIDAILGRKKDDTKPEQQDNTNIKKNTKSINKQKVNNQQSTTYKTKNNNNLKADNKSQHINNYSKQSKYKNDNSKKDIKEKKQSSTYDDSK